MSSTIQHPPIDGSITVLPGLADFHAQHNPDIPWAVYPSSETNVSSISWKEFVKATHRVAHRLSPNVDRKPSRDVVAMLIHCDTLLYVTALAGIARTGYVPFPVSTRNSPEAVAHLLVKSSCKRVLTQPALKHLLSAHAEKVHVADATALIVDDLPDIRDIYPGIDTQHGAIITPEVEQYPDPGKPADHELAMILHSAGSTGLPKPIPLTQKIIVQWINQPLFPGSRKHRISWASMALPTFHSMGILTQLMGPLVTACPVGLFGPRSPAPPVVPNPQNMLEASKLCGCNAVMTVPAFVEAWAQSEESVEYLRSLKMLFFGGGPLSIEVGTKFFTAGVTIVSGYGATEIGPIVHAFDGWDEDPSSPNRKTPEDWAWQRMPPVTRPRWVPQEDGTYELQLLTCETHQPSIENLPDVPGYATNDLWVPHPTKEGLWRIVGRKDDVIVLGSGEKIVPVPQERHIASHPWVSDAVMFGRERPQAGVLIDPTPDRAVNTKDEAAVSTFIDYIWPVIEQANEAAPTFARIFREMVVISDPARPLPRAAKGNVQRKPALELYANIIEERYKQWESSADPRESSFPKSWESEDIEEWLLSITAAVNQGQPLHSTVDIFEQGFDSLHATFIRNYIVRALRASPETALQDASKSVSQNIVYAHPTVKGLAIAIASIVSLNASTNHNKDQARHVDELVAKYSVDLTVVPERPLAATANMVILLTGSTGSLGSYILATLIADPRITKVYAFNRGSSSNSALERQKASFADRGLSVSLLEPSEQLVFITGDFNQSNFGLEQVVYNELASSITHVVHNAWKVDFNYALGSFESQIAGSRRLVDFCASLDQSVRVLFTSSVGVAHAWPSSRGLVPDTPLDNAAYANDSGYSASKYVVEQVLSRAHANGFEAISLRVGQVCGSASSGAWNITDWFPILVKSSVALGCMPDLVEPITWIPVDELARAILDLLVSEERLPPLMNVVHPSPVTWKDVMSAVCTVLGVSLNMVPLKEWLEKLEVVSENSDTESMDSIPAIKLLGFFRTLMPTGDDDMNTRPVFSTSKLQAYSPTIRSICSLGPEHIAAWIKYWKDRGF